jgi:hypothetical protein
MPIYNLQFPAEVNNNDAHINFTAETYSFVAPNGQDAALIDGQGKPIWGCSLYVPGGIQETTGTEWAGESVALALNQGKFDSASIGAAVAKGVAGKLGLGGAAASTIQAGFGKNLAPNEVLIFKGSRHRTLMLQFEMVPKSASEANSIRDIVKGFRNHLLPVFKEDNNYIAYLEFPAIWDIEVFAKDYSGSSRREYNPGNPDKDFLQFANMALTEVSVGYSQGHAAMIMYEDGSPVSTNLTLTFTSIRPALQGNNAISSDREAIAKSEDDLAKKSFTE